MYANICEPAVLQYRTALWTCNEKEALGAQGSTGCSRKHWVLKEALCAALGKEESIQNQMELHLLFQHSCTCFLVFAGLSPFW